MLLAAALCPGPAEHRGPACQMELRGSQGQEAPGGSCQAFVVRAQRCTLDRGAHQAPWSTRGQRHCRSLRRGPHSGTEDVAHPHFPKWQGGLRSQQIRG